MKKNTISFFVKASLILIYFTIGCSNNVFSQYPGNAFFKDLQLKYTGENTVITNLPVIKSLPLNSDNYLPNTDNVNWYLESRSDYRYSLTGKLTSQTLKSLSNQNRIKDSIAYDSYGNITFSGAFQWKNNTWSIYAGILTTRTYNTSGKEVESVEQSFNSVTFVNTQRVTTIYNPNGTPAEDVYYTWQMNSWQLSSKQVFIYSNASSPLSELISYQYINGTWQNNSKFSNLVWHNYNNYDIESYLALGWINNSWEPQHKGTYTYDSFGGFTFIEERLMNNAWVNKHRGSNIYDSKINHIGEKRESWINNTWRLDTENRSLLTYDQNNFISERISQSWNFSINGYKNRTKQVYSNFLVISGMNQEMEKSRINIYPNPTSGLLNINLSQHQQALQISVSDLTGKTVLKHNFTLSETKQLNLDNLTPGVYLLHLETKEGKTIRKIVKN